MNKYLAETVWMQELHRKKRVNFEVFLCIFCMTASLIASSDAAVPVQCPQCGWFESSGDLGVFILQYCPITGNGGPRSIRDSRTAMSPIVHWFFPTINNDLKNIHLKWKCYNSTSHGSPSQLTKLPHSKIKKVSARATLGENSWEVTTRDGWFGGQHCSSARQFNSPKLFIPSSIGCTSRKKSWTEFFVSMTMRWK